MAKVVASKVTAGETSNTITVSLSSHAVDDVVFIMVSGLNASGMSTPSGWQTVGALNNSGSARNAIYYQRVVTAPMANPTVTHTGGSFDMGAVSVTVRGADVSSATSAFDVLGQTTSGSALTVTSPALTTSAANELILLFTSGERSTEDPFLQAGDGIDLAYVNDGGGHYVLGVGYTYSPTTTSPQYTSVIADDAAGGIGIFAIAIVDDGSGDIAGYPKQGGTANLLCINVGDHGEAVTGQVDVTDVAFTPQMSSITSSVSGTSYTTVNDSFSGEGNVHKLFPNALGVGLQANSAESPNYIMRGLEFTTSVDLSNSKIVFSALSEPYMESLDNLGRTIGFGDGTNASIFLYDGSDATVKSTLGIQTYLIDTSATGYEVETYGAGSLSWSGVDHIIHGCKPTNYGGRYFYTGPMYTLDTMTMLGGSSTTPATFDDCAKTAIGGALNTVGNQSGQTQGQFYSLQDIQVGDGTAVTYWQSQYQAIEFPSAYDYNSGVVQAQMDAGALKFSIYASSSDTMDFDITTFNMGNYHLWEVSASSSASATYSFASCNVLNADPTIQGLGLNTYAGISFIGCKELTLNGFNSASTKTIGAATISSCVDTYAVTVTNQDEFEALKNVDFTGNNYSIRITGNHGGATWSLAGATVSGGTGSYDIRYEGTGTLTIEADTGSGWSQSRAEATVGTLTISSPTLSLTVTSNIAGSDIKIFNTNTQTIEASTTGTTVSTTNTGTYDITVQKAGYLPQRQTGIALSGSSVTRDIILVKDPIYNASHGLTFTTDYSYNASTRVMTIAANQEGRDLYSALIADFITEPSLRNCPFPLTAIGPDRIDFNAVGYYNSATTVGATIDAGDIQYWKGAGMVWEHDTTGNPTKKFYSIKSANTLQAGTVVGYTQTNNGTPVESTLVSNQVNEVIQFFEDTDGNGTADYNRTGHLLFKGFLTGYYQARWDVINDSGITSLEPYEYTINLLQTAIAGTTGNQTITIATLTDHTSSPLVVGGKNFDYELVDPGANTAEALLAQYNYDVYTAVNTSISGTIYTSYQAFDLPDLIVEAGSNYETERGYFEGDGAVTDLSGVYLSRSSSDHPDIARYQSNDGTYYTPAVTANISISNLPDDVGGDTRLQIYNINTATLIYSGDPAGTSYSDSYTDTDPAYASSGDSVRIRFAHANGSTSFEYGQTIVTATSDGITANGDNFIGVDSVYATNGIDGSTVTKFTYSAVDDQFNLTINSNFTAAELFAFYCYTLTTADGIEGAYGAFVASDAGNYKNITSVADIFLDNETTASKRQTDTARIYKDDGSYPVLDPTTSGFGIDINWQNVVYVVTAGSGLTAGQAAELTSASEAATVNTKIGTPSVTVSDDIAAISAGGDATQAKQDAIIANLAVVDSVVDAILVDTGTTIPAQISALNDFDPLNDTVARVTLCDTVTTNTDMRGTDGANTTAPDNASITAIKAKTDSLTFTKANELDANIQSVNDVTVTGTGASGDEWGP